MNNKKLFLLIILFMFANLSYAEVIKLKNGSLVSGSIVKENTHTLNVKTQYGVVSLNRKEVVQIMPDMYKVSLKNGGEIIGTIDDINEVFVKVNTETGVKNIDLEKVISMDVYDYNTAPKPALVQGAGPIEPQITSAPPPTTVNEGGISFDDDLDRAFNKQSSVPQDSIVQYNSGTGAGAVASANVSSTQNAGTVSVAQKQQPKKQKKQSKKNTTKEKIITDKYKQKAFIVEAVLINTSIKLDTSFLTGGNTYETGSLGYGAGVKYLKKNGKKFWYGAGLLISSFSSKDFTLDDTSTIRTNTSIKNLEVLTNYYLNPESKHKFYLSGALGYTTTEVNYKHTDTSQTATSYREKSKGASYSLGVGVERNFKDQAIGAEIRALNSKRGGKLSSSSGTDVIASLRLNWKF